MLHFTYYQKKHQLLVHCDQKQAGQKQINEGGAATGIMNSNQITAPDWH